MRLDEAIHDCGRALASLQLSGLRSDGGALSFAHAARRLPPIPSGKLPIPSSLQHSPFTISFTFLSACVICARIHSISVYIGVKSSPAHILILDSTRPFDIVSPLLRGFTAHLFLHPRPSPPTEVTEYNRRHDWGGAS